MDSFAIRFLLSLLFAFCSNVSLFSVQTENHDISKNHIPSIDASHLVGQFESGMIYAILPSQSSQGLWVKLNMSLPADEENASTAKLTLHSLFAGTKTMSSPEILNRLKNLKLNFNVGHLTKLNEIECCLQFSLENSDMETLQNLLALIHELIFAPSLTDESIELARLQWFQPPNPSSKSLSTASEVRSFHASWFKPEKMQLSISGIANAETALEVTSKVFGPFVKDSVQAIAIKDNENLPSYSRSVEYNFANQVYVIDGKIWMNKPSYLNQSKIGRTLGFLLLLAGIGAFITVPLGSLPLLFFFGGTFITTAGVYFLSSPYLKDPFYVEKVRSDDLKKGCAHAFRHSRGGITLTPYERRSLFIQEMVFEPQKLDQLPILLLADLYHLQEPVFSEMFSVEEFNILNRIKLDFVLQRNEFKKLKMMLENELASLTAPYGVIRDLHLDQAKEIHNNNYYVIEEKKIKNDRDNAIYYAEMNFNNKSISEDQRNAEIRQANQLYESIQSDPSFRSGLNAAQEDWQRNVREIEATYESQVELCKATIHYYERMHSLDAGENSLTVYFNGELSKWISTFPMSVPSLPDFLDLRISSRNAS
jgi:hypothetical protein